MDYTSGLKKSATTARVWLGLGVFALAMPACGDSGDSIAYMPDEVPSGRCDTDGDTEGCAGTSDSGSTTREPDGGAGSPCGRSGECNEGLVCSAPFSEGERGEFACVEVCIDDMDERRWCADAGACCDPDAVCTARGYCIGPGGETTSDGGSTDDGSTGETSSTDETTGDSSGGEASTGGEEE
jgi:hypothetical protein